MTIPTTPSEALQATTTTVTRERKTTSSSGWVGVAVAILLAIAAVLIFIWSVNDGEGQSVLLTVLGLVGSLVAVLAAVATCSGLVVNAPNEARVLTFLGRYSGSLQSPGFSWVMPFTLRKRVSLRIRTLDSDVLKVNDQAGNPVEIAAVINWRVVDTARASFDVENYASFVGVQTEAAIRHVASEYPYDDHGSARPSLRENADDVMRTLTGDLQQRLDVAGVTVLDARLRRLAYAPEIAQEMLRRQQASAVVAARQLIVEGAVGMVEHALEMLNERQVVQLDEERKAAMVSNLLVVLCSDRGAQPVINSGSLY